MSSDFIKKMVNDRQIESNTYSTIVTALQDARELSGLDKETGKLNLLLINIEGESVLGLGTSLIGLINYLLILDMLGSIFIKINSTEPEENSNKIKYGLKQFTDLNDEDIDTLKALRNCLAHNYSLLNKPRYEKDDAKELHAFSICWKKQTSLINYPDKSHRVTRINSFDEKKHFTEICAESLRDVVEDVFQKIKEGVNNGTVESYISDDEIKSRFTYSYE